MKKNFTLKKIIYFFSSLSLKTRISLFFMMSTLLPIIITVLFSYNTMSSILTNKLHSTFNNNLHQTRLALESTINDMNYISQQIVFSEEIKFKLGSFLRQEDFYERYKLYNDLKNEFNLISFNSSIGLSLIYVVNTDQYLFNSHGVKEGFSIKNNPLLIEGYKLDNFGPHISKEKYNDEYVLSLVRKMDIDYYSDVYLYIESNMNLTKYILEEDKVNHTKYLIVNDDNQIIYSEDPDTFSLKSRFIGHKQSKKFGVLNGYNWFKETSDLGWSVISLIPTEKYKQEVNQWKNKIIFSVILFILISLMIGTLLWKTIYKPIEQLSSEIDLMSKNNFHSKIITTKIPEFVKLTKHFRKMKKQITTLISEIKQKEKKRADLEVEKLVHQINPHFLMNTLDTARWLAVSGDKEEVTHLLTALNKILYYNMGKLGGLSTLKEELDSMEQYLQIQQIRYDFTYLIDNLVTDKLLNSTVPRFILQPLVENSIYHGLVDDGEIRITVSNDLNRIILKVSDNGRGIPKEDIYKLLNENNSQQKKEGMGIGLNYVKRILEHTYGERASIELISQLNKGTSVIIKIPIKHEKN